MDRSAMKIMAGTAVEGIEAMASGQQIVAIVLVGAMSPDRAGLVNYTVCSNVDAFHSRRALERALEELDGEQPQGPEGLS